MKECKLYCDRCKEEIDKLQKVTNVEVRFQNLINKNIKIDLCEEDADAFDKYIEAWTEGKEITTEELEATENGEYVPEENKAYSKVTVNVNQSKLLAWKDTEDSIVFSMEEIPAAETVLFGINEGKIAIITKVSESTETEIVGEDGKTYTRDATEDVE